MPLRGVTIRAIVKTLPPPPGTELVRATAVSARPAVAGRLTVRGNPALADESMASNLYRQEAVRNAVRHAKASRLEIVLQQEGPDLTLTDNGPGMGLRITAHRAEIIPGEFGVEPPQGGGTAVRCRIPASAG